MHLPDAIDAIRPSIVQILLEERRTGTFPVADSNPIGTGFIVTSAGHVLTARHVVEAADPVLAQGGRLLSGLAVPNLSGPIQIRGSFELVETNFVARDARHDLALLQLNNNPFTSGRAPGIHRTPDGSVGVNALWGLASLNLDRPRDGESVAVAGYPLAEPALITTSGHVATAWGVDTRRVVPPGAPDWLEVPDSQDSFLIDAAVNPGNSGGPVFRTYTADVIAVCVAFRIAQGRSGQLPAFFYNSGLAVAVPIQYGVDLLQSHIQQPDASEKGGSPKEP